MFNRWTFALVLLTSAAGSAHAQRNADPTGSWTGTLRGPGAGQVVTIRMQVADGARYAGSLDFPASLSFDVSAPTRVAADTVHVTIRRLAATFVGLVHSSGDTINGIWTQNGASIPLQLARTSLDPVRSRSQKPVRPFPYVETTVQFRSADSIQLAGTLTVPAKTGSYPAVILISGSGPHDRHGTMLGHRPFDVLADHLSRRGIAVLRFDERGVGASSGSYVQSTIHDFADDVLAGVEMLRRHPQVDRGRIGLIGHSEGGLVAPLVAKRSADVAFIVLLAAPGVHMRDVGIQQTEAMNRAAGMPEPMVAAQVALMTSLFDMFQTDTTAQFAARARPILERHLEATMVPLSLREQMVGSVLSRFDTPMSRVAFRYDPVPALEVLRVPVLALNGSLDTQVLPGPNLAGIRAAMQSSPQLLTTIELPGLNHLFQTATSGALSEYGVIDETFAPVAMHEITNWVLSIARRPSR